MTERPRPPEIRTERNVRFLGEQDGPPERDLKAALAADLASSKAERAYLAVVSYGDPKSLEVALCIRGPEDRGLVTSVAARFRALFGREAYLDILFLTAAQEQELRRLCRPFYGADVGG